MSFNRNDLEGDDDFNFDDNSVFEFGDTNDDDFSFDDEPADIGLDDDAGGFGFEDEDMPVIDDEESEGGGVSRTFIIIAAAMILLFVLGLGAVLFIATQQTGPTPFDQTRVAIENMNATTAANALLTQTANAINAMTQTAIALQPTETPTATPTPITPTFTPTPTVDPTQAAANALLTQQAVELTQTAEFLLTPPTPTEVQQVGAQDVALTATALALLLQPATLDPNAPTQEVFLTPGTGVGVPTALPETGFFDDLAAGNANIGTIALMALGLVGVILVSRRLRTENK